MADLQELLSSISPEDMAKIQSVAQSIMSGEKNEPQKSEETPANPLGGDTLMRIASAMQKSGKDDSRIRLINDLKPLLSNERRKKAEDAVRFLQLMEVLPLLKGLF